MIPNPNPRLERNWHAILKTINVKNNVQLFYFGMIFNSRFLNFLLEKIENRNIHPDLHDRELMSCLLAMLKMNP